MTTITALECPCSTTKTSFPLKRDIIASFCSGLRIILLSFSLQTRAIELPRNPPFSTETFSRESFDTNYTQANLMDLLTD